MKYMRSDIPIFFVCRAIEWTRESVRPTFFEAPGIVIPASSVQRERYALKLREHMLK
jgi:hypothetical protein